MQRASDLTAGQGVHVPDGLAGRAEAGHGVVGWLILKLIKLYQWLLSPILGQQCRFQPTCSHYMAGCIEAHGTFRGVWLGLRRIGRCHPWHPGGVDRVPGKDRSGHPHHGAHDQTTREGGTSRPSGLPSVARPTPGRCIPDSATSEENHHEENHPAARRSLTSPVAPSKDRAHLASGVPTE